MIMEYQKVINLLDNTSIQPSKFRKKNLIEINDDSHVLIAAIVKLNLKFHH